MAGSVAGTPEPAIGPARQAAAPVVRPVRRTVEPVREEVVRPAVEPVNGVAGPAVEPVVGTAEPARRVAKPAIEPVVRTAEPVRGMVGPVAEPVVEPAGRATEPVGQRTAEPVVEPAVRAARPGGTPEAGYPAASRVEPAVARSLELEPDAAPIRERAEPEVRLTGPPVPDAAATALPVAREAAGLSPATSWDPENPVYRVAAATSSSRLSDPYGLLGRAVVDGERRLAVGVASVAVGATTSDQKTPQPLSFGGVPAGAGASGVLGAGAGGVGLAVLALLLFLFRVGGSLSWLSIELHRPNSVPIVAITERPG